MAVTQAEVAKLYVATFNRAPDAAGLNYWTNSSGLSIEGIAQSFFDQSETQTLYPTSTSNNSFVTSVYDNLFNRTPDTAGLNYWVNELNNGNISKQNFILAVINGALGDDATILTNKQTVGLDFVSKGLDDVTLARSVMANVDATQTSVDSALDLIDSGSNTPVISGIQLISTSSSGVQGNDISQYSSISADGRYIAFSSNSSNLVTGDTNGLTDIFLKDTQTGAITMVSTSSSGLQGNNYSTSPSISADGRYIVFQSLAANLASQGTGGYNTHIFLKDTQTGQTTLVSTTSSGIQTSDNNYSPSISADGRYVTFESRASTSLSGDIYGCLDVFIKDTQTGILTMVSTSSSGTVGNSDSSHSSISADGRYVTFESSTSTLVSGDNNGSKDVFLKDTQTGAITMVSTSSSGIAGNSHSSNSSISADGKYIVFESEATNLVTGDTNGSRDIFLKDIQTGVTTLVSASSSGAIANGFGYSYTPDISADGRYVVFGSTAYNLVTGDTNGNRDIFLKDTQTGAIALLSSSSSGVQGNHTSEIPFISADGTYVVFCSWASNLVDGDTNNKPDIFVVGVNDLF